GAFAGTWEYSSTGDFGYMSISPDRGTTWNSPSRGPLVALSVSGNPTITTPGPPPRPTPAPEPSGLTLAVFGIVSFAGLAWRRRHQAVLALPRRSPAQSAE